MKRISMAMALVVALTVSSVAVAHPGHGSAVEKASISPGHYLIEPTHMPITVIGIALFVACLGVSKMLFRKTGITEQS